MKDTYLSIDMDFWCKHFGIEHTTAFFNKISALNIKPVVVKYHHELAKYASCDNGLTRLLNMDYHSDIADIKECTLDAFNEGTWVNYVRMSENNEFVWYYPLKQCVGYRTGYCHTNIRNNPFNDNNQGKYNWKSVTCIHGEVPDNELDRVSKIGICLSPDWITDVQKTNFVALLDSFGYVDERTKLRLKKAIMHESMHESMDEHKEFTILNHKLLY